jgi:pyrroline-5-carboxylate reductase
MNKIGIFGYGSIGKMLVNSFIKSKAVHADQLMVSELDKLKIKDLRKLYPEVAVAKSAKEIAVSCDYLLICVKPAHACELLYSIKDKIKPSTHIISIAACVTIESVERVFNGKVTKVLPSFTSEVFDGITLVCHNSKVGLDDAKKVENLFSAISTVKLINEEDFELGIVLTSCGPGLIASIFNEFVSAGIKYGSLSQDEVEYLVLKTLNASAKLMYEKKIAFNELIERVATPGGITVEGVDVFREQLPSVFDKMYLNSTKRYRDIQDDTDEQFDKGC